MTVYADVLIVVNYAVNLLLLLAAEKLMGVVVKGWRTSAAALIGAAGSLVIFLPFYGLWFQFLHKLLLSFAMAATAFGIKSIKRLFKGLFLLFTVSFIFAGLMLAVSSFLMPAELLFYNGVVYFDISAVSLIFCTTIAYLALRLLDRLFFSRKHEKELYTLTVTANGKTISFKGLADTGSSLKEPFSGAPVIVCDQNLTEKVWPENADQFRLIPCLTVTGEGVLKGFRPESVQIVGCGKTIETTDVYLASSSQPITGEYQALLNPMIIERTE